MRKRMKLPVLCVLICLLTAALAACDTPAVPNGADTTAGELPAGTPTAPEETSAPEADPTPFDWNLETPAYSLKQVNGGLYITFKEGHIASDADKKNCQVRDVSFDSVEAMVAAVAEGNLTQLQMTQLQTFNPQDENGILLWREDSLYDLSTPADVSLSCVLFHGEYYSFFLEGGELFATGSVMYDSQETVLATKAKLYELYKRDGVTVINEEASTFDGVPCRIVEYRNSTETYRDIYIETEENGQKVDTVLRYLLEDNREFPQRVSDTAPWRVMIYYENQAKGVFADALITEMNSTPTYEWLTAFDLVPFDPASHGSTATE